MVAWAEKRQEETAAEEEMQKMEVSAEAKRHKEERRHQEEKKRHEKQVRHEEERKRKEEKSCEKEKKRHKEEERHEERKREEERKRLQEEQRRKEEAKELAIAHEKAMRELSQSEWNHIQEQLVLVLQTYSQNNSSGSTEAVPPFTPFNWDEESQHCFTSEDDSLRPIPVTSALVEMCQKMNSGRELSATQL